MGSACAKEGGVDATTRQIDAELEKEEALLNAVNKILLLGMAESGKSTIVKQMTIMHLGGFSDQQRATLKKAVHQSTYQVMKKLVSACEQFEITIKSKQARGLASDFDPATIDELTPEIATSMIALWKDPGIQKAYSRKSELELTDSTDYLISNAERFAAPEYVPTDVDILRSRVLTSGILEVDFEADGNRFSVVDVAAQRSDKKRWIHYFEGVKAVVFVASVGDFDQFNADNSNKMLSAINLFHSIASSDWFPRSQMFLFLNKADLLKEKLSAGKTITSVFPDYAGTGQFEDIVSFIQGKFTSARNKSGSPVEVRSFTGIAIDTSSIKGVFAQLRTAITSTL